MKKSFRFLTFIATLLGACAVSAGVPGTINYQGRVAVQGVNFNGTGLFKFAIVEDNPFTQAATATAVVGAGGSIDSINITNSGSGYFAGVPLVSIQGAGSGTTAVAQLHQDGFLLGITVTQPGSGYAVGTTTVSIEAPPPDSRWSNDGSSVNGLIPVQPVSLPVSQGLYSVQLGDTTLANMTTAIPASIFSSDRLRLRIWFSDGVNGFQHMLPDKQLTTVPYAFMAQTVPDGAITSTHIAARAVGSAQLANGAVGSTHLAAGAVGASQLGTGAAAANLAASGQAAVGSGGIVLSATVNPALAAAGYTRIGSARLGDYWRKANPGTAPAARSSHTMVWTGMEWIVWGGTSSSPDINAPVPLGDGYRYNPASSSWQKISSTGAPGARLGHAGVWTGSEMLIWGGHNGVGGEVLGDGALYNPLTDSWRPVSGLNAPLGRTHFSSVWTGTELLIWGGARYATTLGDGARYNPTTNTWTAMSPFNAPSVRWAAAATWTGTEMIIWGGRYFITTLGDGARYYPATNQWTALPAANAPSARSNASATWTGTDVVVFGGDNFNVSVAGGARYRPATNEWLPMSATDAPAARHFHTATWTGSKVVIWGGQTETTALGNGASYQPTSDTWTPITNTSAPSSRYHHSAVWLGDRLAIFGGFGTAAHADGADYHPVLDQWSEQPSTALPSQRVYSTMVQANEEIIIWGGAATSESQFQYNNGARYVPSLDGWRSLSSTGAPSPRLRHTAVWTGTEMIIWGGQFNVGGQNFQLLNTGARYNPATDTWLPVSLTGAPTPRNGHYSIWTGSEMIIWDRNKSDNALYNPVSNTWRPISTVAAPPLEVGYSPVWAGRKMIVWSSATSNAGYIYDPEANTWSAMSTAGAPIARNIPSAVWTGSEMIVFGGAEFVLTGNPFGGLFFVIVPHNHGGIYNPVTNTWRPMAAAPAACSSHAAVWTGTEMIVIGEQAGSGFRYDPVTDIWSSLPSENAPTQPRHYANAVWTGTEILVNDGLDTVGTDPVNPSPPGLWSFTPGRSMQLYMKP
jgi:N-acetylneuraminic acid mutarotase